MPKGKKFDAAEKHFLEKKRQLDKVVRDANETARKAVEYASDLKKENDALKVKMAELEKENAILLKRCGMSEEDLQRAIKSDKAAETVTALMGIMRYVK